MSHLNRTESDFLIEGLDDWVGLWRFARSVRDETPEASPDAIRDVAMRMVGKLVLGGYMRPGNLAEQPLGFEPWKDSPSDAVAHIEREWRELGRDPNIPDICWFANTEEGDRLARKLLADGLGEVRSPNQ